MAKVKTAAVSTESMKSKVRLATHISGAIVVSVTGDFSNWSDEGIELRSAPGDLWEVQLALTPGRYEYRLRVDGEWRDHSEAAERLWNPFGTENCVLMVS